MSSSLSIFEVLYALFEGFKIDLDKGRLKAAFNALDSDRNGVLSRDEFRRAAQLVTMTMSDEEFNTMFDSIDTDHSGTIDLDEFVAALQKVVSSSPNDISDDTEIAVVQVTWRRLSNSEVSSRVFYNSLLSDPACASLNTNVSMERQSRMIFRMLGNAVRGLDRPNALEQVLQKMGRRHLDFGVGPKQYSAVRVALFHTLKQVLGQEFTPFVEQAWRSKWRFIEDNLNFGPVASRL